MFIPPSIYIIPIRTIRMLSSTFFKKVIFFCKSYIWGWVARGHAAPFGKSRTLCDFFYSALWAKSPYGTLPSRALGGTRGESPRRMLVLPRGRASEPTGGYFPPQPESPLWIPQPQTSNLNYRKQFVFFRVH